MLEQPPGPEPTIAPPPAPAAAPAPAQAPSRGTLERDGAIRELFRISGVPANERQLVGLRARRDELRSQLENVTEQRADIQEQLNDNPDADTQRLLKQQLEAASGKVLSLGDAISTTERQIAAAPPELLAATEAVPPPVDVSRLVPRDEAVGTAFSTFGLGIVLTLIASRWRRSRRAGTPTASRPDAHLRQLGLAVEAIAVEVERIGEGQRFVTQLLSERGAVPPVSRPVRGTSVGAEATVDVPLPRGMTPPAARIPTPS